MTSAAEKTSTGAANASWAYTYDATGNRLSATTTGATTPATTPATPAVTTSWAYNDADQTTTRNGSTTGWAYDAAGQQTSSPDWGTATYGSARFSLNSLTAPGASTATTFTYLGSGNTTRTGAGTTTSTNGTLGLATENGTADRRLQQVGHLGRSQLHSLRQSWATGSSSDWPWGRIQCGILCRQGMRCRGILRSRALQRWNGPLLSWRCWVKRLP